MIHKIFLIYFDFIINNISDWAYLTWETICFCSASGSFIVNLFQNCMFVFRPGQYLDLDISLPYNAIKLLKSLQQSDDPLQSEWQEHLGLPVFSEILAFPTCPHPLPSKHLPAVPRMPQPISLQEVGLKTPKDKAAIWITLLVLLPGELGE